MQCHDKKIVPQADGQVRNVTLVGNPNVGKSVIFGLLTGRYVAVSNYPGTTVEIASGNIELEGEKYLIVDTPGVNSLLPMSEDERVTRDILMKEDPSMVLQVGDSKNLVRTLLITTQLAEMGLPMILDLNMIDEAMDRGITIDRDSLQKKLGIPVIGSVAPERKGLRELKAALGECRAAVANLEVNYGELIESYISRIEALLPETKLSRRSLAIMLLSKDESLRSWSNANLPEAVVEEIESLRDQCRVSAGRSVGAIVGEARYKKARELADEVTTRVTEQEGSVAAWLGRVSMHPVWGVAVFLGVLYLVYQFVGVLGADILVGLVEEVLFGEYLNPMFQRVTEVLLPIPFLQDMLVGEYGVITMALTYAIGIIFPITTTFFIAFSILEDSGYLPRLAIMSDRIFSTMGLSGKAVLPMVLGLGCGTMAVMTTRILDRRRERLIATFLLALAVPCAAQLGVIMGMLGSLSAAAMGVWIGAIVGMLLVAGWLAAKILPGEKSEFFLEIPPIRVPKVSNIAVKTYSRVVWYLREAVPLFILGTLILFFLDKIALLGVLEDAASPVISSILGLPEKTTEAFLIGFFRRDYGAAGLFAMSKAGLLDPVQTVVSLVTITLFVPCLAHFLMMIKEMGLRITLLVVGVILPVAIGAGGILNLALRALGISLG